MSKERRNWEKVDRMGEQWWHQNIGRQLERHGPVEEKCRPGCKSMKRRVEIESNLEFDCIAMVSSRYLSGINEGREQFQVQPLPQMPVCYSTEH
jgi:hypothetical protein